MLDRVLFRYVAVGMANTALGLCMIFLARQVVNEYVANLLCYLLVVPISFLSHRNLSFRDKGGRWAAFVRYLPTVLAGYACNLAALKATLGVGFNPYLAQTTAVGCHVLVTYTLSRFFVFVQR